MIIVHGDHNITGPYNPPSHKGIDIGWSYVEEDNKIYANCKGTVVYTEDGLGNMEGASGWGNYVLIKHPNGMYSRYAHLKKGLWVSNGQEVDENTVLGIMGDSGYAFGRHLHYEVQTSASSSTRIDPTPYIDTPIWKPEPTPSLKYKIGDKVVLNGQLYGDSNGGNPGQIVSGVVTYITRAIDGALYPYNTTGDLGWMAEAAITLYEEPTPEPTVLKTGDTVKIKDYGRASSYGDYPIAGGLGWTRQIQAIYADREYPYQVGNEYGTTGFYKAEALEKIG